MTAPQITVPDWDRCTTTLVPALTWGTGCELLPEAVIEADVAVLFVLDSLGWEMLRVASGSTPNLEAMSGGPATTVAPSTTASALTSISTGLAPGEHGIVGYRFPAGGAVMNALRWTTVDGDHRGVVSPSGAQTAPPMAGGPWTVISGRQFAQSGFTEAHLGTTPYVGYEHPSSIVAEVRACIDAGEKRIYAYYDGIDHVAHIYGVSGPHITLELSFCDWLVGQLLATLPTGTALIVTADHGQIDAPGLVAIDPSVLELTTMLSGEPRFRWLHSRPGATSDLVDAASAAHGDKAWVRPAEELLEEKWFGATVSPTARARLGDVALVAKEPIGFDDPAERHADRLVGRHGSVTAAEMYVPVLWAVA